MKRRIFVLFSFLIVASMLLAACQKEDIATEEAVVTEAAAELLTEILKRIHEDNRSLLNDLTKVYTSDVCTICLGDEEVPDLVFYQCGHQCCHYDCGLLVNKCPLCRMLVSGYIKTT